MTKATETTIITVCAADTTIPKDLITQALKVLRGEVRADAPDLSPLSGAEAAKMLSCTRKTVYNWSDAGYIRRVMLPGGKRAAGFNREDVLALQRGVKKVA